MTEPPEADPRQTIRLAYALLLGREPESKAVIELHLEEQGEISVGALRRRFMDSDEFLGSVRAAGIDVRGRLKQIGPTEGLLEVAPQGMDGVFTDRFGVRTRVEYLPPVYQRFSGMVGSADGSFDMPVHEAEEVNALLRAVSEAKNEFAIAELGAGWGPWIVLGAHLARRRGLATTMMGVEGSSDHVAFMVKHLKDNGFDPTQHNVIHAVAGTHDGVARFPKLTDPASSWGAEASFDSAESGSVEMEEVPCLSLRTLLARMPIVDFVHSDVQGAEADVFAAAMDVVNERVRRVCIGTHGRSQEGELLKLFASQNWTLECEEPCKITQQGSEVINVGDGVQVWRNARLL